MLSGDGGAAAAGHARDRRWPTVKGGVAVKGKSTLQALGVVLVTSTTAMAGPSTLELSPQTGTWNFDTDTAAKLPTGWSIRQTRPTKRLATWQVTTDSTAPSKPNVLALTSTENYNGTSYGDCDDGVDRTPTRIEELTARLEDLKCGCPDRRRRGRTSRRRGESPWRRRATYRASLLGRRGVPRLIGRDSFWRSSGSAKCSTWTHGSGPS